MRSRDPERPADGPDERRDSRGTVLRWRRGRGERESAPPMSQEELGWLTDLRIAKEQRVSIAPDDPDEDSVAPTSSGWRGGAPDEPSSGRRAEPSGRHAAPDDAGDVESTGWRSGGRHAADRPRRGEPPTGAAPWTPYGRGPGALGDPSSPPESAGGVPVVPKSGNAPPVPLTPPAAPVGVGEPREARPPTGDPNTVSRMVSEPPAPEPRGGRRRARDLESDVRHSAGEEEPTGRHSLREDTEPTGRHSLREDAPERGWRWRGRWRRPEAPQDRHAAPETPEWRGSADRLPPSAPSGPGGVAAGRAGIPVSPTPPPGPAGRAAVAARGPSETPSSATPSRGVAVPPGPPPEAPVSPARHGGDHPPRDGRSGVRAAAAVPTPPSPGTDTGSPAAKATAAVRPAVAPQDGRTDGAGPESAEGARRPTGLRSELRRQIREERRFKTLALLMVCLVVLGALPLYFAIRAATRDPVFTSLDSLNIPSWAAVNVVDQVNGSRWCFIECRFRERMAESERGPEETAQIYEKALADAGWQRWDVELCPAQPVDGHYTCWRRDELTLDLWVRQPACAQDPKAKRPTIAPTDDSTPAASPSPEETCAGALVSVKVRNAIDDDRIKPVPSFDPSLVGETPDPIITDDPLADLTPGP
ncbi:MAG TPA: hypothetical protein VIL44_11320 [Micromonospora sp.]